MNDPLLELLIWIQNTWVYWLALGFFALYPIVTSLMWITTALFFVLRWEKRDQAPPALTTFPMVSVLVPAHNEELEIGPSLARICAMTYPNFEVVVIDDGSTDRTGEIVGEFVRAGKVRLITKAHNQGKAMALNDALPCLNGEIVLALDADAEPEPDLLHHVVPHFQSARVAAVTGNPRVRNVDSFITRLQLIEFSSIVSLLRRAQRVWGRILTVSGIVAAFRKSAVLDVGGFSPEMATEDIELTWKLQKRFYDVRYEAQAIIWMTVPSTISGLYRQRLRWARGLMQVLRKHCDVIAHRKYRRMWPIFFESVFSTLWAHCFLWLTLLWAVSYLKGYPPIGAHPIPNLWGMTIMTLCLTQLLIGAWIDRRYDPQTLSYYPYAVFYPIVYWMFMAATTVRAFPTLLRKPPRTPMLWRTPRAKRARAPVP